MARRATAVAAARPPRTSRVRARTRTLLLDAARARVRSQRRRRRGHPRDRRRGRRRERHLLQLLPYPRGAARGGEPAAGRALRPRHHGQRRARRRSGGARRDRRRVASVGRPLRDPIWGAAILRVWVSSPTLAWLHGGRRAARRPARRPSPRPPPLRRARRPRSTWCRAPSSPACGTCSKSRAGAEHRVAPCGAGPPRPRHRRGRGRRDRASAAAAPLSRLTPPAARAGAPPVPSGSAPSRGRPHGS